MAEEQVESQGQMQSLEDPVLAQVNVAGMKESLESPLMQGFVDRLDEINALAESSDGFIWRLKDDEGAATTITIFNDPMLLINMSIWESIDALWNFTYKTAHVAVFRDRKQWFNAMEMPHLALWWVESGVEPTVSDAEARLRHLESHGPTKFAFTFKQRFEP